MEVSSTGSSKTYNRLKELKAFEETKAGVKGLIDSGITKIPKIFLMPEEIGNTNTNTTPISGKLTSTQFNIPVIDLNDIVEKRSDIVAVIRQAAGTAGFFQVVNHGIPVKLLEEMMAAVREFHELPQEMKAEYFTRDGHKVKRVVYRSNFDLYQSKFANWRDTLSCVMGPEPLDPQELPPVCRDVTMQYYKQIQELGSLVFELLSEALGLKTNHLEGMDCTKGHIIKCHYYPPCPEPNLTMGTTKHSDPDFLTILLQDHIGGLQVLSPNGWIDVIPVHGALLVNIGDLLQLISNNIFKSVEHRVLANHNKCPRISVACFFALDFHPTTRMYGPIKELLSKDNPAIYKEITLKEFATYYDNKGLDGNSALPHFMLKH